MSELLTYSISDFILFSSETYARLFERYYQEIGLIGWLGMTTWLTILWLIHCRQIKWAALLVTASFIWTGWAFHMERYAVLNWAATYFGWAFIIEGVLIAALVAKADIRHHPAIMILAALGVAAHPMINLANGHPWPETGLFGTAPDPSVVTALGLMLAIRSPWRRRSLSVIPVLWCLVALTTSFGLNRSELAITAGAGLIIWIVASIFTSRKRP